MGYDMVKRILNMKQNRMQGMPTHREQHSEDGHYPYMGGRHLPPMYPYGMRDYAMTNNARSGGGRNDYGGSRNYVRGNDYDYEDYGRRKRDSRGRYTKDRAGSDYGEDYGYDYGYDYGDDYGKEMMYLTEKDMKHWKQKLENADGTHGEHFKIEKVMPVIQKLNMRFDGYDEKDLFMVMNMLYSDFCEVNKPYIMPDNEPVYYAKLAKAWLDDKDAPSAKEKLALYYYCIVDAEE